MASRPAEDTAPPVTGREQAAIEKPSPVNGPPASSRFWDCDAFSVTRIIWP